MNLSLRNVSKTLRNNTVISDISVEWCSGHIYGLKGINGAGKTMLMRLISGLLRPSQGEIYFDGEKLGAKFDFAPSTGLLLENPGFLAHYTGFQNLAMIASLNHKISSAQIQNVLNRVGLDTQKNKKYRKYSLGMQQRLGIAAAIMETPDLIILDEPLNALDSSGCELAKSIIQEERDRGALIVLTCHNSEDLYALSDQVYTLEAGRIVQIEAGKRIC